MNIQSFNETMTHLDLLHLIEAMTSHNRQEFSFLLIGELRAYAVERFCWTHFENTK